MNNGLLISLEGMDGVGKTTQAARLSSHISDSVLVREPGGTRVGEEIRGILKSRDFDVDPIAELLMFGASRAQLLSEVVRPALQAGKVVIMDRYYHSTIAYQMFGRGLKSEVVLNSLALATDNLTPNLTLYLDCSKDCARGRMIGRSADRFENDDGFTDRVRSGFEKMAGIQFFRMTRIDASRDEDAVHSEIMSHVSPLIKAADIEVAP